jgi:elongation factor G
VPAPHPEREAVMASDNVRGTRAGNDNDAEARCIALVGPFAAGKTSLLESLLFACGGVSRRGSVDDGTALGDFAPEARARRMSVEPVFAGCSFLGSRFHFIDCPGSVEFQQAMHDVLPLADAAVLVCEPDPAKAALLAPYVRALDDAGVPYWLFINKIDRARGRIRDLLPVLQPVVQRPLVLRQVPVREGERITGYVDLASERTWRYRADGPSQQIDLPLDARDREQFARGEMLERLADFDDHLMEELLNDTAPETAEVYADLALELQRRQIVPVLLGSGLQGGGVFRLLKAMRHEAPDAAMTAQRLGIASGAAVARTLHGPQGRLSLLRLFGAGLREGGMLGGQKAGALFRVQGSEIVKAQSAGPGDVVAVAKLEGFGAGDRVDGARRPAPPAPEPVYALAVSTARREDEVKLTEALARLVDEDRSLSFGQDSELHQLLLRGQGEIHLACAIARLASRFGLKLVTAPAQVPYRESIRRSATVRGRHKRQSGGHGQFGDVVLEIAPLPRGEGFRFDNRIVGGVVPKQYIPGVEAGVRDAMLKGPLGFPVVDVAVALTDGSYHSVDSSDMAFRTAGRIGMQDGLAQCGPVLLEPLCAVSIHAPSEHNARINAIVAARRGQLLGFDGREGWPGWDTVQALMPMAELTDLIVELRSATQGAATYTARFERMQELTGRTADQVLAAHRAA